MVETQTIEILTLSLANHPGYLKKLEQIINSGVLEVKGAVAEIWFDADGSIRKIKSPQVTFFDK